ncbi:MAG: glycosyltransferase [Clostridiales bacterium]|nr:glycosyltransferase [Clostridiales bacterium]
MKKKILMVISSLSMGGIEKSMINFCNVFDYEKYDADLYLFNEGRALLHKLNKNVNLLPNSPYYADVYNRSILQSVKTLLKKKKIGLAIYRIWRFIRIRFGSKKFTVNDWRQMRKTMLKLDTHYDVAIGFEENTSCYYVAECVNADVKVGWIRTDIKKIDNNKKLDRKAFEKLDSIVTVSDNSLNSLKEAYPEFSNKYQCINLPKLMNVKELNALAAVPNNIDYNGIKILSLGRLVELKGFHLCVPVCRWLLDEGYNLKWYIAGDGDYRSVVEAEIAKYGLEENFILLGNCDNPYTYIYAADICVQPSSYEGLSRVLLEEKYFKKPIVATGIPSNLEIIEDGVNGIIVNRDSKDIYNAVKVLLDNSDLRERLGNAPARGDIDNNKIMSAIEKTFVRRDA